VPLKRRSILILGSLAVLLAAVLWYLYAPRRTPAGQPPLATIRNGSLEALRADFNRDSGHVRIILLLSPT
jgi:hypothetical protein